MKLSYLPFKVVKNENLLNEQKNLGVTLKWKKIKGRKGD